MEDEKEQLQKRIDRMQKKVLPKSIVCYHVMCFLIIITLSKNVHLTEINHVISLTST